MEKLGINPLLLVAQIVNFGIVLFLLKKFLYTPVVKVLDERKKKSEEIDEMHTKANDKVAGAQKEEQKIKKEAQTEAETIIANAKLQGEKEKEEIVKQGEKEVATMRAKLEQEFAREKQELVKELKAQAADLSVMVAEKILKDTLDETKQKTLVSKAIKDLEKVTLH